MTECELCKQEIKKGQRFIINGTVPSTWTNVAYRLTRGPAIWSIADFGKDSIRKNLNELKNQFYDNGTLEVFGIGMKFPGSQSEYDHLIKILEKLRKISKQEKRSLSNMITYLIEKY